MFPCVCSVIDHRRRKNVVGTSVTHSAIASCATYLFLSHFDVICDLLLNTRFATRSTFYVPKIRTNYGKFNIRYNGPILQNETDERFKILTPYSFKRELSSQFINFYYILVLIAMFWCFYYYFVFYFIYFLLHTCLRIICSVIYFLN